VCVWRGRGPPRRVLVAAHGSLRPGRARTSNRAGGRAAHSVHDHGRGLCEGGELEALKAKPPNMGFSTPPGSLAMGELGKPPRTAFG